ncbi:MAG: HDOD domain-containing protein [Planctomycetota bacterium]
MTTSTEQREQIVNAAIREISHIATLPEITLKIIDLVEDPKSTAQDLHEVIGNDPALSSRILKVVNSSFYGLPGQIGSINRAIVLLGLNAVKNIAIAASLAKLFRGGDLTPTFSAKKLWNHSTAVAATSKFISDQLKLGLGDEAYLSGLMHDIGVMVEMQFDRNKLIEAVNSTGASADGVPANNLMDCELAVFGATHQDFGKGLCEKWKFPKSFATVCGHHHEPMEVAPDSRTLVSVVYVADRLVMNIEDGFRLDIIDEAINPAVKEQLSLTDEKIAQIREALPEKLADADSMS